MNAGAWRDWILRSSEMASYQCVRRANETPANEHLFVTQDSRELVHAASSLKAFIALQGSWHNGHDFIEEAYANGARYFIIESGTNTPDWEDADVLWCPNTLEAWQSLAQHWRQTCDASILAITGSNGKTTVKEWLLQFFSAESDVFGSPRSYNSQVGVPLALGELRPHHKLGVFEAGISEPGEMQNLQSCLLPEFGVLTHIGDAHLENFDTQNDLMVEKLTLFQSCQWVAMPHGLEAARVHLEQSGITVYSWGEEPDATLRVQSRPHANGRNIEAHWQGKTHAWNLGISGEIAFRNAMTAALTGLLLDRSAEDIAEGLTQFNDLDHRMQRIRKSDGRWILSDAYTNDWDALQLALMDLGRIPDNASKAAIIGPISGMRAGDEQRLIPLTENAKIDVVWLVGSTWGEIKPSANWRHFDTIEKALETLHSKPGSFADFHVLVKGPRAGRYNRITDLLSEQGNATNLVLDLEAYTHNLRLIREYTRSHCASKTDVLAVIKASGYGTNAAAMARVLQFHRVPLVAVACAEEGIELRKHGISMRILVLNPTSVTLAALIAHRLEPTIHNIDQFNDLVQSLESNDIASSWPIHLKVDSGMHRLGFAPEDCATMLEIVQHPRVQVESVFSHLAGAEDPRLDERTKNQLRKFNEALGVLREVRPQLKSHILNTSGLIRFPEEAGDYVRVGIGLLGVQPTPSAPLPLEPVVRFLTSISSLHKIPANEGVGYGLEDASDHERILATLPVGYADGFPRNLSNGKGSVIIHGQKARVVGKVCMDMVMVDVTHLSPLNIGTPVEIFGKTQRIESFAKDAETIPYEILTRIPHRVIRTQSGN